MLEKFIGKFVGVLFGGETFRRELPSISILVPDRDSYRKSAANTVAIPHSACALVWRA